MRVPLRYLTLAALFADFAMAGMLPTLFILAQGSRWAGPGRYRGALEAGRKLTRIIAWIVRGKALYGLLLVTAQLLGWLTLPWPAVISLVTLFLTWEVLLEASGALRRFVREREGTEDTDESANRRTGAVGPNRAAKWVLLAAAVTLLIEVTIFLVVILPGLFIVD